MSKRFILKVRQLSSYTKSKLFNINYVLDKDVQGWAKSLLADKIMAMCNSCDKQFTSKIIARHVRICKRRHEKIKGKKTAKEATKETKTA